VVFCGVLWWFVGCYVCCGYSDVGWQCGWQCGVDVSGPDRRGRGSRWPVRSGTATPGPFHGTRSTAFAGSPTSPACARVGRGCGMSEQASEQASELHRHTRANASQPASQSVTTVTGAGCNAPAWTHCRSGGRRALPKVLVSMPWCWPCPRPRPRCSGLILCCG